MAGKTQPRWLQPHFLQQRHLVSLNPMGNKGKAKQSSSWKSGGRSQRIKRHKRPDSDDFVTGEGLSDDDFSSSGESTGTTERRRKEPIAPTTAAQPQHQTSTKARTTSTPVPSAKSGGKSTKQAGPTPKAPVPVPTPPQPSTGACGAIVTWE